MNCSVVLPEAKKGHGTVATAKQARACLVIITAVRLRAREHGEVTANQYAAPGRSTEWPVSSAKGTQGTDCPIRARSNYFRPRRAYCRSGPWQSCLGMLGGPFHCSMSKPFAKESYQHRSAGYMCAEPLLSLLGQSGDLRLQPVLFIMQYSHPP